MAAKIKLARFGKKGRPFYRIIIADESERRQGRVVEPIGYYDPKSNPVKIEVDKKLLQKWLGVGAQPTDAVRKLLSL